MFRLMDSYDGNKKIDKEEFTEGMSRIGLSMSADQISGVMALLDTNQDGMLDFNEFLVGMRGLPSERRQAIIDKCFLAFDKDCSGMIEASDLRVVYNYEAHPKFKEGTMTGDQVFVEWLGNFADTSGDGKISRDEWNDYYAAVSSSIDNDDHFIELMKMGWKVE